MEKDLEDLKNYVEDHIRHFNMIPLDFETESGELWDYDKVWETCEKLDLIKLLK